MDKGILVGRYMANIDGGIVIKIINSKGQTVEVPVKVSDNMLDNVNTHCKLDDVIGIKYYLEPDRIHDVAFVADKITFLSHGTADVQLGGETDGNI
jgi:hypothetical protein